MIKIRENTNNLRITDFLVPPDSIQVYYNSNHVSHEFHGALNKIRISNRLLKRIVKRHPKVHKTNEIPPMVSTMLLLESCEMSRKYEVTNKQYRKWKAANERAKKEEAARYNRLTGGKNKPIPVQSGPPKGISPEDWKYMTPEERALFR